MARVFCENPNDFPVGFQTSNEKIRKVRSKNGKGFFCKNPNDFPVGFQTRNEKNRTVRNKNGKGFLQKSQ